MAERDYSALTDPVEKAEVVAFHNSVKRLGGYNEWHLSSLIGMAIAGVVLIVVPVVVVSILLALVQRESAQPTLIVWTITAVVFGAAVICFGVAAITLVLNDLDRREDWYRFRRFAADNDLGYAARAKNEHGFSGTFFRPGTATLVDRFTTGGRYEYGNVRRNKNSTAKNKAGEYHFGGYLAIRLDRKLPRMLLDSHSNNRLRDGLGSFIDDSQRLDLEGDFGRHFTLYTPAGYERDALYVFTPDLMALFIDQVARFDVEIADDWMFVYPAKPFNFRDPRVHEKLADIAEAVGQRANRRSVNYRDERVGSFAANAVTPHGRRLRRGGVGVYASVLGVATWIALVAPPIAVSILDGR